jgi:hypothetical protein
MRLLPDRYLGIALLTIAGILAVHSYATDVSVSTVAFQSQYGLTFGIDSTFTAIDQGFSNITSTQTASVQPCIWLNGTVCNTALTINHLQYAVALNLKTQPLLLTTYTVTAHWSQNGGSSVLLGQLAVTVSALAIPGQQMTFSFDTAGSSLASPMSLSVVVS